MTLNANYAGATAIPGRAKLEGVERGLDALIGLVIVVVELVIGFLAIYSLYLSGLDNASDPNATVQTGFLVALIAGSGFVALTTLVYLSRVIVGRRSWPAPLWGLILMTGAVGTGYLIMSGSL